MNDINTRIEHVVEHYTKIDSWEERYTELIASGKKLPSLNKEEQIDENKLKGCQSQVWLTASLQGDRIIFRADSDASIVKGIISLLISVYSGSTPLEILSTKPEFLEVIGLKQHLSMSRANGLNAMVKQITIYAMAFQAKMNM